MRIAIPDDVADDYLALHPTKPLDETVEKQLQRFNTIPLHERILVVRGAHIQRLETLLNTGNIRTGDDLVAAVESRHRVSLGGVDLEFSAGQKDEIARRAVKERVSPDEMLRRIVKETLHLLLDAI